MSLQQINDTANDATFRNRVEASTVKAAVNVVGEDTSAMSDQKARKRHTLGVQVLNRGNIESFIWAVASQVGEVADPGTIADLDIDNAVSSVWDDIAGVLATE